MTAVGDTFLPRTEKGWLVTGLETKGRPRPARGPAEEAEGTGDFARLYDVWWSEAWPGSLLCKWPSGAGSEDSAGVVGLAGLALGRKSSLVVDG